MNRLPTTRTLISLVLGLAALGSLAATPANSRTARERQTFEAPQPQSSEQARTVAKPEEKADKAGETAPQKTASQQPRGHQA